MPDLTPLAERGRGDLTLPRQLRESELVRRAQLGSGPAFDQLVVRRGPDLYRYLVVRLRNENDARDVLQETLTAAWLSLPTLRDPDKFWPWLVAIGRRKASRVTRSPRSDGDLAAEPLVNSDERVIEIREAIRALPSRLREVLVLRYGLQLSEEETAEVLGVRLGTVKSRSARARVALVELLA